MSCLLRILYDVLSPSEFFKVFPQNVANGISGTLDFKIFQGCAPRCPRGFSVLALSPSYFSHPDCHYSGKLHAYNPSAKLHLTHVHWRSSSAAPKYKTLHGEFGSLVNELIRDCSWSMMMQWEAECWGKANWRCRKPLIFAEQQKFRRVRSDIGHQVIRDKIEIYNMVLKWREKEESCRSSRMSTIKLYENTESCNLCE